MGLAAVLALVPAACVMKPPAATVGGDPSIAQLQDDLAKGRTTARAVTDHYIARIATIDSSGPSLHSVLEVNPDATSIASSLDSTHAEKGPDRKSTRLNSSHSEISRMPSSA